MELNLSNLITNKRILVTGGTGSIGRVLVQELLQHDPKAIRILSRDIAKQSEFQNELKNNPKVRFLIGDIRDQNRVMMAAEEVDMIFHIAAFKYVPQGEYNPFEVVQTNVLGTQNLITAALKVPTVTHFAMISTDKAVQPISTMGASKLLAERLVTAAHYIKGAKQKTFVTVRFGNVLGTSGSVIPLFRKQMEQGRITVTHPDMARFFMTIPDAAKLVLSAVAIARGGEIFVLKMPALTIKDLAEVCVRRFSKTPVQINFSGIRPGEKMHETLLTTDEALHTLETNQLYIVLPQIEVGDIRFDNYTYYGAEQLKTHNYDTSMAPKLSHLEIESLLERAKMI